MRVMLNMWGKDHEITFQNGRYTNGNFAVQALAAEDGGWVPWCMVTVNLGDKLPENQAYLDTNGCSKEIIEWLYENGYVTDLGISRSGFCNYPLVKFSKEFIDSLDL